MSVLALILATLLVIAMLVVVFYVGKARLYKGMYEDRRERQSQLWQTILNNNERIVEMKQTIAELEERVEDHLTCISSMDDQIRELKQTIDGLNKLTIKMDEENRELGQTVIDQGKLILMKDDEINELERSCQSPLRDQVNMLREEVIQKCKLNEALRGEEVNAKELLRLAEEANIGHVKQIHQLQADKAKVLAEFKDYRIFMIDDEIDPPEVNDTYFAHQNKNGFVYKWWKEERELAAKQIVEEELTASPEPCTEMGTKPADMSA